MNPRHGTSLKTRSSLLKRLKAGDDSAGWQEFYDTYGGLIRFFCAKAGLTAEEADEVVQETAIGVAQGLPRFTYDPKVCRFKTWLLNLTRWRIQDQLRRRKAIGGSMTGDVAGSLPRRRDPHSEPTEQTPTAERIPDPASREFGAEWDEAWEKNLLAQALEHVRARIDERQFQVFDLCVTKEWPPAEVARTLGLSPARVYLIKHRVLAQVRKEVQRLERLVTPRP